MKYKYINLEAGWEYQKENGSVSFVVRRNINHRGRPAWRYFEATCGVAGGNGEAASRSRQYW